MKNILIGSLCLIALLSSCKNVCGNKVVRSPSGTVMVEKPRDPRIKIYDLFFLGHYIRSSEDSLYSVMAQLYADDPNVMFDKETGNIDICGTLFHVNHSQGALYLMSSVQPGTSGIKKVRKYISRFHGEAHYEEPGHYSWPSYIDSTLIETNYSRVRLRRVRSAEGGTAIIVS